jgi:transposase
VILKRKFGTPEYSWLVDAWLDYMQANMQHNLDLQPWVFYYRDARVRKGDVAEVLSVKQAAGLLGMTADNVMEFVDKGLIEATQAHMGPSPGPGQRVFVGTNTPGVTKRPRRVTLIDIDAVNRLNQIRASQVSLTAVAHRLGVGEAVIRDIVRVGLLLTERKYDRRRRGVRLDDLEAFLSRLSENSIPLHRPADVPNLLTIDRARQQVSYHKLSIARMLDAVMRGVLPAYRLPAASGEDTAPRDKGLRSIGDLLFKLDDVRAFVAAEPLPEGRELLSRGLVRQVLKCNHSALTTFEATGLLVPVEQDPETPKSLWRYDNLDVELFRERYIGTAEAARILGCTRSTLNTLAALGNIRSDCVAHAQDGRYDRWLFDSYALKDWVADRIRVQDAAEILGAHPESVRTWAREGRLTRVSNLWFSRREVTEWRDDRVSTKDAAMLIGVGLQSFIAWVNAGRFTPLAALAHNKWWFFSRKELTRWRAERMTAKEAMAALSIPKYQL